MPLRSKAPDPAKAPKPDTADANDFIHRATAVSFGPPEWKAPGVRADRWEELSTRLPEPTLIALDWYWDQFRRKGKLKKQEIVNEAILRFLHKELRRMGIKEEDLP